MALTRVTAAGQIASGSMVEVQIRGKVYAICNVDGAFHAVSGTCPHRGGPLAHGALHGHTIVCPWHAWEFDCRTGQYDFNRDIRLDRPALVQQGDAIYLDLPDA